MSFLNSLKSQADALRTQQHGQTQSFEANVATSEKAAALVVQYFRDLAAQLNVIEPAGPRYSLDGKTAWPPMKAVQFRSDARKKMLRGKEAFDFIALGWDVVPAIGGKLPGSVKVNFPPDLERVTLRLAHGNIQHERRELRDPEKNSLLAIEFNFECALRASVTVSVNHETAKLEFRLSNLTGFETHKVPLDARSLDSAALDELAKLIVGQPNQFLV